MKRIGILVVAYNAASTLAQVLDRIPRDFIPRIDEVLVGDDHSQDSTYLVGLGYQQQSGDLPLTVVRHPRNLGYGGDRKSTRRRGGRNRPPTLALAPARGPAARRAPPAHPRPRGRAQAAAPVG